MKRTRTLFRKITAAAAASTLLLSGSSTVLAASYQEAEKAALSQFIKGFSSYWDVVMEDQEKAMAGTKAVMTLKLEDGGKTLLSAASGGMDFSWLNTLTMDMTAAVTEGKEIVNGAILLNDSPLCNMNMYMDLNELVEYLQIPELSETWMKMPLLDSLEISEEELAQTFESEEEMQAYMEYMEAYKASMKNNFKVLSDLTSFLPDTATVSALLDRYGNIIIDSTAEGTSSEETISVEGISEDCTVYESQITEVGVLSMMKNILTTAKEDQELKGLLDKWSETSGEDLNAQLQTNADALLADLTGEGSDAAVVTSKAWVNADGKIIGREISAEDETGSIPVFTWKNPSSDEKSALFIEFGAGEETMTFTGTGQSSEGLLNGEYVFAVNSVKMLGIKAENLETHPKVPGYYNGKIGVSVLDAGTEEAPNPLAAFGLDINVASDAEAKTNQVDFTVTNSGAALVTLSVNGGYADASVSAPEQAVLDASLDITEEGAETSYIQGMDWTAILDNASAAGAPAELVGAFDQMIQQAVDNALNPPQEEEITETESAADAAA
ncbi:MAG: hypothetical protein SOR79_06105 [Blautia sp.]|uniref:hypothetical protein n=1 Tax=Blautia sp. TaxID=1955243 RepID=UPI002A75E7BE|nr:hypothetical protein [Blautia sp.]MDY3016706.1 hypothetical protein [Blautia sp.]